jgi:Tfp pilus assembly protein PilN
MIETNLGMSYKPTKLPKVAGIDLNVVNFPLVGIAFLVGMMAPGYLLTPGWQEELKAINEQERKILSEEKELKKKIKEFKYIEEQIVELQAQEQRLKEKLRVVRKIIKTRKTPANLLLYIAKNIPDDLWLSEITIESDKFVLKGKSLSFLSVRDFIQSLRTSIFFRDLRMDSTQAKEDETRGLD